MSTGCYDSTGNGVSVQCRQAELALQEGGPSGRLGTKTQKDIRSSWNDRPYQAMGFQLLGIFEEGLPAMC